uniref:Uncharacterized protein n=1 Tax=Rhipicephalus zambeziensis TaxID=60191 RepID=A0A224YZX1_9ACAR
MSEAQQKQQQQRKRKRQPKQVRQQQQQPPNSMQLQNDLVAYQAWLAEQLQYTAYLQHNGPVAQYLRRPTQTAARREPTKTPPPAAKTQRTVATWTCFEPDGPPRCYFSDKRWKCQVRSSAKCAEDQCPRIFRGRTVSAGAPAMPPPPDCRVCDDCGGTVVDESSHRRSRLHREAVEMDVSLICARIRRDPAFAAAVIAAARQCVENTGVEESASSDDEVPAKRPADDFEFLEGDVFKPASQN